MKSRLCSLRRPVCVESATAGKTNREELALLERALEEVVFGQDLPDLFASWERPLRWELDETRRFQLEVRLLPEEGFDRGAPRCVGGDIDLETARRCALGASLAARAPATADWLVDGWAAASALELGDAPRANAELRASLAHPEAGIFTSSRTSPSRPEDRPAWVTPLRSGRFFSYLAERAQQSVATSGYISLSLAATETPAGALRFMAEPDLADVLRATLGYDRAEMAHLYDDFAKWSFFEAERKSTPLAVDWEIDGESLPRSVAFPSPMEPTGSVYALLHLPPSQRDEVIGFRTSCETPVSYVWSITRLDGENRPISSFPLTFQERNPDASGRVLPAEKMEKLLVVGTNLGGVALTHPFDPDHGPHEAHGCKLSIDVVPAAGAPVTPGTE